MRESPEADRGTLPRPLVIGCGALARELVALTRRAGFPEMDLTCLPATLHNRPERIPEAVRGRIRRARAAGREQLFVAYADCGTGGQLDRVLEEEGVARLEGAHCYQVYAGHAAFARLAEEEPGTFYLTDFLARNFDRLVIRGLGLDRHPELLPLYFGNYRRVVYLAQTDDPALTSAARRGARRLGLRFERRYTGYGELAPALDRVSSAVADGPAPASRDRASSTRPAAGSMGPVAPAMRSATLAVVPAAPALGPVVPVAPALGPAAGSTRPAAGSTRRPAPLASGASSRSFASGPGPELAHSLLHTQATDHSAAMAASGWLQLAPNPVRRPSSRRYLRSTQGAGDPLRVAQEAGGSAVGGSGVGDPLRVAQEAGGSAVGGSGFGGLGVGGSEVGASGVGGSGVRSGPAVTGRRTTTVPQRGAH